MAEPSRRAGALRRLVGWTLFAAALAVGIVGFVVYREVTADLPPVDQLLSYQPPEATRVFADDGTLIGEFYVERRYVVPLDRIPAHVRLAFLAAEDADFYRHPGVDPMGIARAMITNLVHHSVVQGGSTITQQVVKTLLLTPERSFERKAKEMVLSLKLESKLTKDEILWLYLNQIYFGAGAYGIQAAAQTFFGCDVENLTIAQAALLAGLPRAPSRYDPQRSSKEARARQQYVLGRMRDEHFITQEQYAAAEQEPMVIQPRRGAAYMDAPWYVEHVRRLLEERYGGTAAAQLGLRVHTAVDLGMQHAADEAMREGLQTLDRRQGFRGPLRHLDPNKIDLFLAREARLPHPAEGTRRAVVMNVKATGLAVNTGTERGDIPAAALVYGRSKLSPQTFKTGDVISVTRQADGPDGVARFALDQEPQVQGALVAFDPYTGEVKAMVGGSDFGRSQFNRVTQARRQPGSAIKPFIYAAAIDKGFTPASVVVDAPISFPAGNGHVWTPHNYGDKYYGPVALRTALTRSLNTVSVRLVDSMGLDYVRSFIGRFGFSHPLPRNLSLALGSAEVTPLELVRGYGVFTTLGKKFEPIFITAVTDRDGKPIDFGSTRPRFQRVLSQATAFVVTSMMESVVQNGTGRKASELGRPVAGKTGTTNDTHDAWFVGFTPDLLAGVWVGFDSDRSLGPKETGGVAAAPIWTAFMQQAVADRPVLDFPVPEDVTYAQIDPASGLRAVPGGAAELEVFVRGTEPTRFAQAEPLDTQPVSADGNDHAPDGAAPTPPPPPPPAPTDGF
jgi:penicillin-binding protein 1A